MVSPAQRVVDEPGLHAFSLTVRDVQGIVSVDVQGDLSENVRFTQDRVEAIDGVAVFTGTVVVPADLAPGDHPQALVASAVADQGDVVGASVGVASTLIVRVPYDGPYLAASAYVSADEGSSADTATLYVTVENRGTAVITPHVTFSRELGTPLPLDMGELQSKGFGSATAQLSGRGEEMLEVVVSGTAVGANEVRIPITAAIGRPMITSLRADAVPEPGRIKPIEVEASVDWNRPVQATLFVDGKETAVTIDRTFSQTVYVENPAGPIAITLRISRDERTVTVPFAAQAVPAAESQWPWLLFAVLFVLVACAAGYVWWRVRHA